MKSITTTASNLVYFAFYISGLGYTGYNISRNVRSFLNYGVWDWTNLANYYDRKDDSQTPVKHVLIEYFPTWVDVEVKRYSSISKSYDLRRNVRFSFA